MSVRTFSVRQVADIMQCKKTQEETTEEVLCLHVKWRFKFVFEVDEQKSTSSDEGP